MFPILLANLVSRALTPRSARRRAPPPGPGGIGKPINLALQGGGAHGAFTWGVLDQLLEDGRTYWAEVREALPLVDSRSTSGHDNPATVLSPAAAFAA